MKRTTLIAISLILLLLPCLSSSKQTVRSQRQLIKAPFEGKPLYLPSIRYVRLFTFGFERLTADVLWFATLNYFGKQLENDDNMPWFGHMCDLVTDLDPKSRHHYEFCSTLLSWVADKPEKSEELLSRAIDAEPDYWRYYYLRGFNRWYFLERQEEASADFVLGAKQPGAPSFMASLGSRLLVSKGDTSTAIRILKEMISSSESEDAKQALKQRLDLVYISRDISYLNKLVHKYRSEFGRMPNSLAELAEAGLIKGVPLDPYRKPYLIDSSDGQITASDGSQGLKFVGKTAKTGLAKNERARRLKKSFKDKQTLDRQKVSQ
jgi:hypothetical protein